MNDTWDEFGGGLDKSKAKSLMKEVSNTETIIASGSLGSWKSPGLDGFHPQFYKIN